MTERTGQLERRIGDLIEMTRECVAEAIGRLEAREGDPVKAIHRSRKAIRSARAMLRLARPAMDESEWSGIRDDLREASGLLSEHRDAHVICETFDDIAARAGVAGEPASEALRAETFRLATLPAGALEQHAGAALDRLIAADQTIGRIASQRTKSGVAAAALHDSARRAGRALRRQMKHPSDEHAHELRKRCKDLREQLAALSFVRPGRFCRLSKSCDRAAGLLGGARDIRALLRTLADAECREPAVRAIQAELSERGARRAAKLDRRGVRIACEALSRSPASLARDVRRGW